MSKKIKLLALTLACVATLGMGMVTAFASAKTKITVEDSFNDLTYEGSTNSQKWTSTFSDPANPTIKQSGSENPSLQFVENLSGGEQVQYGTASKVENIQSVTFSLKMAEGIKNTEKWMAVNFVPQTYGTMGSNHYYSPIMINPSYVYVKGETDFGKQWRDIFPEYIQEYGSVAETWVSFKLIPTSDTTLEVYVALRGDTIDDTEFPQEPIFTITGTRQDAKDSLIGAGISEDISYKNAYVLFGFEGRGHGSNIDDIRVVGSNMTAADDFTSGIRSEELRTYPDGNIGVALKIMDNNTLEITNAKAGDRVVSNVKIDEETSIAEGIIVFEASFRVKMTKSSTDEVAFVFGLESSSSDPRQNGYAYVIGKDYGRVIKYADSQIVEETDITNSLIQVTSKKGADISIKVYKDCSVEVYEDGNLRANLPLADTYVGHVGFAALSDTAGTVNIDNVVIKQTTYYVPVTKSVTHNFSNDFFGNEGTEDFIVSNNAGAIVVEDGKLYFDNCSDETFFGPAHQYDSYIMDFQLCSIDVSEGRTANDKWIGLDVGRPTAGATDYGLNVMFGVTIVPVAGVNSVGVWAFFNNRSTTDTESITVINHRQIPASLFRNIQFDNVSKTEGQIKAGDAVCFRWVSDATNENLKLYIKKACESEYVLYAEIKGVNTSGYQAIRCTGWTSFKIDNFSMANTSPIYEVADNEVPETIYADPIIEHVYTKPDVDVNWEEEIRLNGQVKDEASSGSGSGSSGGCKGAVTGGAGLTALALLGACLVRRKKH
ncbi:MAG: hypothetical protein IKA61_05835 [Clostridia bacterium]|nr:hypothetical protein [Clostridia bacterium]